MYFLVIPAIKALPAPPYIVVMVARKTFGAGKDIGGGGEAGFSNIVYPQIMSARHGFGGIWTIGLGHHLGKTH